MEQKVKSVKRRNYDGSRRREQALQTRAAIVSAARSRFLSEGYGATTIASIAADADASPDTIYKAFGGKAGLIRAMCQEALAGDGPISAEVRSDALMSSETDPRRLLQRLGTLTTEVAPRIAPLLLLLSNAADGDSALLGLRIELEEARLTRMTHVARGLAAKTQLRDGQSVERAADIMWMVSSPELYRLLVLTRGWSAGEYGDFIGESLGDALLGPEGGEPPNGDDTHIRSGDGGTRQGPRDQRGRHGADPQESGRPFLARDLSGRHG
jgi:AcrR family transcriptional regulator